MSRDQNARKVALDRRAGMSPGARDRFEKANEEADNWKGTCSKCRQEIRGTLAQMRAHNEACEG